MLPLEPATAPIISETLTTDVKVMIMGPIQDFQKERRKNSLASVCSPTTRSDEKSELRARDVEPNDAKLSANAECHNFCTPYPLVNGPHPPST